jgi:hypothetical protein
MTDTTMEEERIAEQVDREMKAKMNRKSGKMRTKHKLLLIVLSLALMVLLRTGFMFIIIAILPSIVAYYVDVTAERYTFKTIMAANLCGVMPFLEKMLIAGPSNAVLQSIMGSALNWVIIYGAALMGWLLVQICPTLSQVMVVGFHNSQAARIQHLQKKILSEWGNEVTEFSKIHDETD